MTMDRPIYQQQCCVVFPSSTPELFYMNMRVYRVRRAEDLDTAARDQSRLIWCAVYQPSQTETQGGCT